MSKILTNILKCFFKSCCKCFKCLCCSVCNFFYKYLVVAACSCVIGMVTMAFIVLFYYGVFYPAQRTATLEHTGMYDYDDQRKVKGHNSYNQKEGINTADSNEYSQEEYYYDTDEGDKDMLRNKRNLSAGPDAVPNVSDSPTSPSSTATTTTTMNVASQEVTLSSSESSTSTSFTSETNSVTGNLTTHKSMFAHINHPTTTQLPDDDPDFHLGNVVMNAVFSHAEESDMKQTLGLCRKNAELKVPQFKATLFPGEQAADILNCINDLLRNQTKKQICLHLDAEMNAYLKWLVLTGESKERHKPVKIAAKEDFLFPSSCASEQSAVTPECLVEPVVREDLEE